ncbi:MAG: DUF433 domain-containing protein [Saprospiraceae bacterium]
MPKKKSDRITYDEKVMGGKACIRGMRVTVKTIFGLYQTGNSINKILKYYPYLESDDVEAALDYLN